MDTGKEIQCENNEIKKLLELNLQRNEDILLMMRDIKKYIKWQKIWSIFRFVLIVVPIVLGFIYLPPLLQDLFQSYRDLFNGR